MTAPLPVEVCVLGPVRATVGASAVPLGPRQRSVFARLVLAGGALRIRLLPVPVALALPAVTVGALLVGVLPVEGYGIIPGTVVFGLGMAAAGWVSRRPA